MPGWLTVPPDTSLMNDRAGACEDQAERAKELSDKFCSWRGLAPARVAGAEEQKSAASTSGGGLVRRRAAVRFAAAGLALGLAIWRAFRAAAGNTTGIAAATTAALADSARTDSGLR